MGGPILPRTVEAPSGLIALDHGSVYLPEKLEAQAQSSLRPCLVVTDILQQLPATKGSRTVNSLRPAAGAPRERPP
jgi:hypothetical protein